MTHKFISHESFLIHAPSPHTQLLFQHTHNDPTEHNSSTDVMLEVWQLEDKTERRERERVDSIQFHGNHNMLSRDTFTYSRFISFFSVSGKEKRLFNHDYFNSRREEVCTFLKKSHSVSDNYKIV